MSAPTGFGQADMPGLNTSRSSARVRNGYIPPILPHEKVFPIQIGNKLFRLSGASLSSDAPSYFSAFFDCQLREVEQKRKEGDDGAAVRTLYIDRDPAIFMDIAQHLQGYHVTPRDGQHFVKLFADAQFYQLPRLVDQLYEEAIHVSIGGREFRIPKEVFSSPGNTSNYFTLGYAFLFSTPSEVFPGLQSDGLLRPPSIMPPAIPNHSADIFADLLHMLRGYPVHIRDEEHRRALLKDCKYFLFKGIEQQLIAHRITFNSSRMCNEILIRLEDLRQTGVSCVIESSLVDGLTVSAGWVNYARPFVDDNSYEMIVEIGHEWMKLNTSDMRAEFFGEGKKRISRLVEIVTNKVKASITSHANTPTQSREPTRTAAAVDRIKCAFDQGSLTLDGKPFTRPADLAYEEDFMGEESEEESSSNNLEPSRKRRRVTILDNGKAMPMIWTVQTGQWRLKYQYNTKRGDGVDITLVAVKIDAVSGEKARNDQRTLLGS